MIKKIKYNEEILWIVKVLILKSVLSFIILRLNVKNSKNGIEIMIGIIEKRIKFFLFKNMYHHNYKFINLFII